MGGFLSQMEEGIDEKILKNVPKQTAIYFPMTVR